MKALKYKEKIEKADKEISFKPNDEETAAQEFFKERKDQLIKNRKNKKIEEIWKAADKAYEPHTIADSNGRKVVASDETLGWRANLIDLNRTGAWREDSVPPNPYIKVQTALGIIIDRNPKGTFKSGKKKYQANTLLIEDLYGNSWKLAKSKSILLKPFVFNMAKYGIGCGRTYPMKITRTVGDAVSVDPETGKAEYEDTEFVYFDDVFRKSLSPWQCWFDDGGIVGNPWSFNDNMWFEDYSWEDFQTQFGHLPNSKYVKPTIRELKLEEYDSESGETTKGAISKRQVRLWFYENLAVDRYYVETDSDRVVLINEPIPRKPRHKRLSLFTAPWSLRNDRQIEGIGVYEAMRNDHKLYLKVRNMTMDQLVASINKSFFYEGTDFQEKDGTYELIPGRGYKVVNPQNIRWNEVPPPGREAWEGLEFLEKKMEESTGITRTLTGEIVGKTAFETAQAREAGLKRMKTPLDNLIDALEIEAYNTVSLIDDLYSIPKIKLVAEDRYVEAWEREKMMNEAMTQGQELPIFEDEFREVPLNLESGEDGKFVRSKEEQFTTLLPDYLEWEGTIEISAMSVIADSELLERQNVQELATIITPLLTLPPQLVLKPATEIIKAYKKDPEDWLPDVWTNPQLMMQQTSPLPSGNPIFVPPQFPQGPETQNPQALPERPGLAEAMIRPGV